MGDVQKRAAARRAVLLLTMALAGTALCGACGLKLEIEECTVGTSTCEGDVRHYCELSLDGDPRMDSENCARTGKACHDGKCSMRVTEEPCPEATARFCREGRVFHCVRSLVSEAGQECQADRVCLERTSDDGVTSAHCGLDIGPCGDETRHWECRDQTLVQCQLGVAIEQTDCAECLESNNDLRPRCVLDLPPCASNADDSWECRDATLIHCEGGLPVDEIHCAADCVEQDGDAKCVAS